MCWTSYLCRYQCCILLDFLLARPLVFMPRPGTCIVSIYLRFIFLDNLLCHWDWDQGGYSGGSVYYRILPHHCERTTGVAEAT